MKEHDDGPTFTVCICTRNRVAYLRDTIEAVRTQALPRGLFDVLVVDNGSSDGTSDMVNECFGSSENLIVRCVREEVAGLSRARNRALAETTSDFIAFLDDDAIPAPGWLAALSDAFISSPDVDVVGGGIIPVYEGGAPVWLSSRVEAVFMPQIPGEGLRPVRYPHYPYGANIAFRRTIFHRIGLFREDLGYCGSNLVPAEETELLIRAEKSGAIILFEPRASVRHLIPRERVTKKYLRKRFLTIGVGRYEVEKTRRQDFENWGGREIVTELGHCVWKYFVAWRVMYRVRWLGAADGFDRELDGREKMGLHRARMKEALAQLKKRVRTAFGG